MTADELRQALAEHAAAEARASELAQGLATLRARDADASQALFAAEQALTETLALAQLDEATPERVTAARATRDAAAEQVRGIEAAIELVEARACKQAEVIDACAERVTAVVAELAVPLVRRAYDAVQHHASGLGEALRLFYRLEAATRGGDGFLTGVAAHNAAGAPGSILQQARMRCDDFMIYPMLRDRIDDLTPRQLLALLQDS